MPRLVFITGASSGIGQAMALRYAKAGWRLALVARRLKVMQEWAEAQGLPPEQCACYAADVCDAASISAAAQACIATQGLPDVVIANAGLAMGLDPASFEHLALLRDVHAANVYGLAATFQPFIQPLCERGSGTLVGIASGAGLRGMPGNGAYGSSKAAVISYCESLRGDYRDAGIKVVTIAPGYVATPMTDDNPFPMPFLITPEVFADRAFEAVEAGARFRVIPWQMGVMLRLFRNMPDALFDRVAAKLPRKQRQGT